MLAEIKYLSMDHQITIEPKLSFMYWVLFDPPSHKVGHACQCLSSNGSSIYVIGLKQALKAQESSYMKKWPKWPWSPLLLHCLLLPDLHLWFHEEFSKTSWQRKGRCRPGLQTILHNMQVSLENEQLYNSSSLEHPWRTMVKGNLSVVRT